MPGRAELDRKRQQEEEAAAAAAREEAEEASGQHEHNRERLEWRKAEQLWKADKKKVLGAAVDRTAVLYSSVQAVPFFVSGGRSLR